MTVQYMTLVKVSYHQHNVYFQLCSSCIKIFADFLSCSNLREHTSEFPQLVKHLQIVLII